MTWWTLNSCVTHRVFDGVVHDDVIIPHRQPGTQSDHITILQRFRTLPLNNHKQIINFNNSGADEELFGMSHTWGELHYGNVFTGIVADVRVHRQFADVKGLDHVRVPFSPIINVMEHIIHGFCRNVLTHHPTLRERERETLLFITHNAPGPPFCKWEKLRK